MRILTVLGTRPEAIKLAPVIRELSGRRDVVHATCATGQHRELADSVLDLFGITPDHDLRLWRPGQELGDLLAAIIAGVGAVIRSFRPDWVVVQGDTTTAYGAALAAFHARVGIAHVEAGLRTGDLASPWPEEMYRQAISRMAARHFAPTRRAAANLLAEGIDRHMIFVTGNTAIDALLWTVQRLPEPDYDALAKRLILVTGHRRENLDGGLENMCRAVREIAGRGDVEIVYPVHPNPTVQATARILLAACPAVRLVEPLSYPAFVDLMRRTCLIISDSGGIQEEAPALGKPVIVTRESTERMEVVNAGAAILAGTDASAIVAAANRLLDDPAAYSAIARPRMLFGRGDAGARIAAALRIARK